jgi:hypothetical protein
LLRIDHHLEIENLRDPAKAEREEAILDLNLTPAFARELRPLPSGSFTHLDLL